METNENLLITPEIEARQLPALITRSLSQKLHGIAMEQWRNGDFSVSPLLHSQPMGKPNFLSNPMQS